MSKADCFLKTTGKVKYQIISLQVWSDEYLQWNPDQFGNISSVYLPQADVWLPDLVLYNEYVTC